MKKNKGFSMVEMLVVIAIISVLLAVSVPTFRNSKIKAGEKADIQTVSALYAEVKAAYDIRGEKNYKPKDGWPVMEENCPGKDNSDVITELYGLDIGKGWEKGQKVEIKVVVDENDPDRVEFVAYYS